MKDNYDFSTSVKNPYADKLKNGYTVTVHYDFTQNCDIGKHAKKNDVSDDDRSCQQA